MKIYEWTSRKITAIEAGHVLNHNFITLVNMLNAFFKHHSAGMLSRPAIFPSILLIFSAAFFPLIVSANPTLAEGTNDRVEIAIGYSYRTDEFDWNIAGTSEGTDPNILSELTWEDLVVHQLNFGVRTLKRKGLYLKSALDHGWIVGGENQDSDYNADDRQGEYSRSNNQSDKGHTLDFSVGIGYSIPFGRDLFLLSPIFGYSYHQQELHMTDGYQTIPDLGAFQGLDSQYDARWQGPWIGADLNIRLSKISRFFGFSELCIGYEHHWVTYDATADWNLRTDFMHPKSFEHEADGGGDKISLGLKSRLGHMTVFGIFYEQQHWATQRGVDRVFLVDGGVIETRLNEVNWHSSAVGIEISIRY
jgi:hypothetical protein